MSQGPVSRIGVEIDLEEMPEPQVVGQLVAWTELLGADGTCGHEPRAVGRLEQISQGSLVQEVGVVIGEPKWLVVATRSARTMCSPSSLLSTRIRFKPQIGSISQETLGCNAAAERCPLSSA
jgi:hypothetical protein